MGKRFNPLDPLGLFQERDGTQAERIVQTRHDVSQRGITSVQEISNTLWPPPDPLGLFHRSNPGNPERRRFSPPDPLGIITPGVPDPYDAELRQLRQDLRDGAISEENYKAAVKDVLSRKHPAKATGATIGNPIPIEFNGHLVDIKNQAREVLIGKGYQPQRIDMALKWAEEWLMGMAKRMAPGNIDLQKTIVRSGYEEIAYRAEKWLQGIQAAFGSPGVTR